MFVVTRSAVDFCGHLCNTPVDVHVMPVTDEHRARAKKLLDDRPTTSKDETLKKVIEDEIGSYSRNLADAIVEVIDGDASLPWSVVSGW